MYVNVICCLSHSVLHISLRLGFICTCTPYLHVRISHHLYAGYQYGHIPWADADITVLVDERGVPKFCLQELASKVHYILHVHVQCTCTFCLSVVYNINYTSIIMQVYIACVYVCEVFVCPYMEEFALQTEASEFSSTYRSLSLWSGLNSHTTCRQLSDHPELYVHIEYLAHFYT